MRISKLITAALVSISTWTSLAIITPTPASAQALCPSGRFCVFSGNNYTGTRSVSSTNPPIGVCYNIGFGLARSAINYTSGFIVTFESTGCNQQGALQGFDPNTSDPHMTARSWMRI